MWTLAGNLSLPSHVSEFDLSPWVIHLVIPLIYLFIATLSLQALFGKTIIYTCIDKQHVLIEYLSHVIICVCPKAWEWAKYDVLNRYNTDILYANLTLRYSALIILSHYPHIYLSIFQEIRQCMRQSRSIIKTCIIHFSLSLEPITLWRKRR